jgi:hypothetical protein
MKLSITKQLLRNARALHIKTNTQAVTETESVVKPNSATDDLAWKFVTFVIIHI